MGLLPYLLIEFNNKTQRIHLAPHGVWRHSREKTYDIPFLGAFFFGIGIFEAGLLLLLLNPATSHAPACRPTSSLYTDVFGYPIV